MTEVNYNGKEELLMADYEGISDSDLSSKYANTDFDITDAPSTYITNTQMTYALTCRRLFPAGDTYICNDEGTYKKGHTYTIKVVGETKSWEDVTPTPTIDNTITSTSNNPVKSSGIYTAIQSKQDKLTAGTNITIDENNVISASGGNNNAVLLDTTPQYFDGDKTLYFDTSKRLYIKRKNGNPNEFIEIGKDHIVLQESLGNFIQLMCSSVNNGVLVKRKNNKDLIVIIPNVEGWRTMAFIEDINAKVPDAPDTDGTYTLKCVVSNGVKTYQWVLDV